MSQKNWIIIASAVIIFLVGGGGLFFYMRGGSLTGGSQVTPTTGAIQVLKLKPDDIGLNLTRITSRGVEAVHMTITKLDGINSIDYELAYTALTKDNTRVPRGVIGQLTVKPTDTTLNQDILLGTCSDVCHPDTDPQNIKLTLKVTKSDGKVYEIEQEAPAQ